MSVPANVLLSLDELQAQHIQFVLEYCSGHKGKICEILKISRPALGWAGLDWKIERYHLELAAVNSKHSA